MHQVPVGKKRHQCVSGWELSKRAGNRRQFRSWHWVWNLSSSGSPMARVTKVKQRVRTPRLDIISTFEEIFLVICVKNCIAIFNFLLLEFWPQLLILNLDRFCFKMTDVNLYFCNKCKVPTFKSTLICNALKKSYVKSWKSAYTLVKKMQQV